MNNTWKKNLLKYGLSALFCLGMAYFYISLREFDGAELVEKYRMLSDAFLIPGLILVLAGLLIWLSNMGSMDGVSYVVKTGLRSLIPGAAYKREKYYDYVERKRAEGGVKGYGFLYIVGGISLAIAIVFMILFYSIYQK